MDKMREEFEEWFFGESGLSVNCENASWQAWQASRRALVVELPDFFVSGIDAAVYRDDVLVALDAAGVAYK